VTPILPYCRVPIVVRDHNAAAPEVARRVAEMIAAKRPGAVAEHVGSSAVPGLAGKGTVDLLLPTPPEEIPAVTDDLLALGFQRQAVSTAFPPTRPMLQGIIRHGDTSFRVHIHVVPAGSSEVAALRGFRDALLADPGLRVEYENLKRTIVDGGTVDSVAFSKAKHAWIVAALERLGLADAAEEAKRGGLP
jgi:GrpB-like predicted nucleotidyltransferase (UPF0157 family)